MFDWYRRSAVCYVYLSDVSAGQVQNNWEEEFRRSRWFTRGWTLQELLAPTSIEFYSHDGSLLGDRYALEHQIHDTTGIAVSALRGGLLSQLSVKERMSWIEIRDTKIEEDLAYALLGIFGVSLPLRYGEGRGSAFQRLEKEIDKLQSCLRDIRLTDPVHHKKRIEHVKGGLLEEPYHWILQNPEFQQWRTDEQSRLLWIKGDPGKGKTMLLCGIINELKKSVFSRTLLSFFFCEATNSRVNNGTAVLRGLIYMLVSQQPLLISHIQKKHDHAGKALFEDLDAWFALSDIFTDIAQDPNLNTTFLIIDALDECIPEDLPKLIDFVVDKSSLSPRIKWLVSSRNWPPIEAQMERAGSKLILCLELNGTSVSTGVSIYIRHKVDRLAQDKRYDEKTRDHILDHLFCNADNTFLWVALVCQNLLNTPRGLIRTRLKSFPTGLNSLYSRMLEQIWDSKDSELCRQILAIVSTVLEPISLQELVSLVELLEEFSEDMDSVREMVTLCGSFLTIRDQRIYFVHQSAKDYLFAEASTNVFTSGVKQVHYEIFSRSLSVMSMKLHRDIYNLGHFGSDILELEQPGANPLAESRYACLYWVDHLCESEIEPHTDVRRNLQDGGPVDLFLRTKYLNWLEAVSLCKGMPKAVLALAKLERLLQGPQPAFLIKFVYDARRFVMYHRQVIERFPLQTYVSALLFSPTGSLVRQHFRTEEPDWITMQPEIAPHWSAYLQTLEGHGSTVNYVALSPDSSQIASASDDATVRIWDTDNGAGLQTLHGHGEYVSSIVFLPSNELVSASGDCTVKVWDISTATCLRTLEGHTRSVTSLIALNDSKLVSASDDGTIKVWDATNGRLVMTIEAHSSTVSSITTSHKSIHLASGSHDCRIKIWRIACGAHVRTLTGHRDIVNSVVFSHDSDRLASASDDGTIRLWDTSNGESVRTLNISRTSFIRSVAFSHGSTRLVCASSDRLIRILSLTGATLQTFKGHSGTVNSVAISGDSTRLVSASHDRTVRVWDTRSDDEQTSRGEHGDTVTAVALSSDGKRVASASYDHTIRVWDLSTGACLQTLEIGHSDTISTLTFLRGSEELQSASGKSSIRTWPRQSDGNNEYVGLSPRTRKRAPGHVGWAGEGRIRGFRRRHATRSPTSLTPRIALTTNGAWITYDSENLIWLPPDYRPSCSVISGSKLGVGVGSGKVWWCSLRESRLPRRLFTIYDLMTLICTVHSTPTAASWSVTM